ncbi:MAG: beta-N-acetylhexosaminidase [Clostridia bacterium]|nr:beta-N-acetylhexosaminidase [Clostridia bacterium]MBQ8837614.1 beta-N-acetylhexosaminidase [Clostridia bacterium]
MEREKERFGVMICCSTSAVMKVERVKKLLDEMQKMGYNLLEMCLDDIYKIESEPYFGYLRGGYTKAELKEIDDYAYERGIEVVPCIQTLAHLNNLVKNPPYWELVDNGGILLVDEPKTYAFVEKMLQALKGCFRSNLINIGMDEAHTVGLGRYLDKHGYVNRHELLVRHLNKVVELATKYGFKPHMWSDMFFRLSNGGGYYGEDIKLEQSAIDKVPEEVALCYWDYGEHEVKDEIYEAMFAAHEKFGRELWFAGGAWCWNGFAPLNEFSLYTMEPAMRLAKKHGVKNVLITLWTDEGNECSFFSVLPSLYAIKQFYEGNLDRAKLAQGFQDIFGVSFDDFMLLDLPNQTGRPRTPFIRENPCKSLLYNDCFLGLLDHSLSLNGHIPYGEYAKTLAAASKRLGEYGYLAEGLSLLCSVLEIKAELGIKTRRAYKDGDIAALEKLTGDYAECAKRLDVFIQSHKKRWLGDNKPFGWEIQQARLGGLHARLLDCKERLTAYLQGDETAVIELDEEILPYVDEWGLNFNSYRGLVSPSEL